MTDARDSTNEMAEGVFVSDRELLIQLATRIVESRAVAEELVQESWLRWHGKDYREADARPIFRRIVSNLAKDWRRSRTVEANALVDVQALYDTAPSTEAAVIARDELAIVLRTLQKMSRRQIRAFRMRTIDGKTYREIGERLGLSLSHARNLVEQVIFEVTLALDD
ncbi:MAG: RNA polymerase sigma factor [Pseudomonadota bacterium]